MIKFPKNFMWGSGMSALQSEGVGTTRAGLNEFEVTFQSRPESFFSQAAPAMGVDSMRHYKEDLALMAKYGHNSFRNSFSWARLFPDGKTLDKKAVAFYHDFLREAKRLGLVRIMTLQHFDLPGIFEKGGHLDPSYPQKFKEYADFIFSEYGNEVEIFATYNEPLPQIMKSHLAGSVWPFMASMQSFLEAAIVIAYTHALAVNLFNEKYRSKSKAKISYVHIVVPTIPKDGINYDAEDKRAAEELGVIYNSMLLDLMVLGKVAPELERFVKRHKYRFDLTERQKKEISKVKLDCMGINYYFVTRVGKPGKNPKTDLEKVSTPYKWEKARFNPFRGWEVLPEAFEWIGKLMRERYGNIPYWIAENGIGVQEEWRYMDKNGTVDDSYRIAFVSEHLEHIHKSIKQGSNCIGYHMWSTYDCWSMTNGYKNTYGFFRVELSTMRRYPKKSAHWFAEVLAKNALPTPYRKLEETIDMKKVDAIPSDQGGVLRVARKT